MGNRFNFNDEDNFPENLFQNSYGEEEAEGYGEEEQDGYEEYDHEADDVAMAIELERRDLNRKILSDTVRTLEQSWLWRFRSEETRNKMIAQAYVAHQRLITQGEYQYIDHTKEEIG